MNDPRKPKCCLFVDNTAIFKAVEALKFGGLDYIKLRDFVLENTDAVILNFYCGEVKESNDSSKRANFYGLLERAGYSIFPQSKPTTQRRNAAFDPEITGKIHCDIVSDMCIMLSQGKYDKFILVTGSPEYAVAISKIKRFGIDVDVYFFESVCSYELMDVATSFTELGPELWLGERRRSKENKEDSFGQRNEGVQCIQ